MSDGLVSKFLGKIFPSRKTPVRPTTQAKHVRDRLYGGSTKDMAQAYGVKARTVQRWMSGHRTPQGETATRLESEAATVQTTERGRGQRAQQLKKKKGRPSGVTMRVSLNAASREDSPIVRGGKSRPPMNVQLTGEQTGKLLENGTDSGLDEAARSALGGYFNCPADDLKIDPGGIEFR